MTGAHLKLYPPWCTKIGTNWQRLGSSSGTEIVKFYHVMVILEGYICPPVWNKIPTTLVGGGEEENHIFHAPHLGYNQYSGMGHQI